MQILKQFLLHNWFAKLFSLMLAAMLWITIASETTSEIGMTVPLEYRNVPPQLEVTGEATNNVEVRLRGSSNLIKELSPSDISATLDMAGMTSGDKVLSLSSQNVRTPFGIEVVRVNPSRVYIGLERTMSKLLPVTPELTGAVAEGYEVRETLVKPYMVEVQGPESKVRPLESVPTTLLDIAQRAGSITEYVDLDVPDPLVRLQYMSPVEVSVVIQEVRTERRLTIGPDPAMAPPEVTFRPATVQVMVRGPKSQVENLTAEELHFTVTSTDLPNGEHEAVPTIVGLPAGLEVISWTPENVKFVIRGRRNSDDAQEILRN